MTESGIQRLVVFLMVFGLIGWGTVLAPTPPVTTAQVALQAVPAVDTLSGRVVAVGIDGASAVSPVGVFLAGSEIHDRPKLAAFTNPGRVLDPERLLVASDSNFGAPLGQPDLPPGAILSIDPRTADRLVVPPNFAAAGGQASTLNGVVQLLTAQSPGFANSIYNPKARTASFTAVSRPRGISMNNAFGRPWFANAPLGATGPGTETIIDPDGRPRAEALSRVAGGVFADQQTNRSPQLIPGALIGSVGTAFLGKSPDGSDRGVYAVVNADGSLVQVHIQQGVDGLAPAGTIGPLSQVHLDATNPTAPIAVRAGMVLNWVPNQILYITDPLRNAVVALTLVDDHQVFRVGDVRRIEVSQLDLPVDLAAAVPEVVSSGFASNTTLAGGADLYVANRGNGTIVRLSQAGTVVAVRQVEVPGLGRLGAGRLNGIAVSANAQKIFVTVSGSLDESPTTEGAVVELPAFGGS